MDKTDLPICCNDNFIRVGRCHYICSNCKKDVSFEILLSESLEETNPQKEKLWN